MKPHRGHRVKHLAAFAFTPGSARRILSGMVRNEIICNLLDPETEPTDEQLARLMHLVGETARERKTAAEARMRETILRETALAIQSLTKPVA